jgi:hypothetical protein
LTYNKASLDNKDKCIYLWVISIAIQKNRFKDLIDLGSLGLVKEFTKTESKKKQRFISMPLKGETMVDSNAKEHSTLTQNGE